MRAGGSSSLWLIAQRVTKDDDLALYAEAFDRMSAGRNPDGDTLEKLTKMVDQVKFRSQGVAYLRSALEEAVGSTLPGLTRFSRPMRLVVGWGLILQRRVFPAPFWLSQRSVAWGLSVPGLLGREGPELVVPRSRGERILYLLVDRHVFEIVERGKPGGRATRYFYRGPEPEGSA